MTIARFHPQLIMVQIFDRKDIQFYWIRFVDKLQNLEDRSDTSSR